MTRAVPLLVACALGAACTPRGPSAQALRYGNATEPGCWSWATESEGTDPQAEEAAAECDPWAVEHDQRVLVDVADEICRSVGTSDFGAREECYRATAQYSGRFRACVVTLWRPAWEICGGGECQWERLLPHELLHCVGETHPTDPPKEFPAETYRQWGLSD